MRRRLEPHHLDPDHERQLEDKSSLPEDERKLVEEELKRLFAVSRLAQRERVELEGCAWLGLYEAKRRFNPSLGDSFSAFARRRVRGAMLNGLAELSPLGMRGVRAVKRMLNVQDLSSSSHHVPLPEASGTGEQSSSFIEGYKRLHEYALSLWMDMCLGTSTNSADSGIDSSGLQEARFLVGSAFEQLSPDDQRLLIAVYDLRRIGDNASQFAERTGVNRSTISRRHAQVLEKLRATLTSHRDED